MAVSSSQKITQWVQSLHEPGRSSWARWRPSQRLRAQVTEAHIVSWLPPESLVQADPEHVERGELVIDDVRHASLMFLSPAVLGLLHQDSLSGSACRPLDLARFLETQVDAFLRAFPARAKRPRRAEARARV